MNKYITTLIVIAASTTIYSAHAATINGVVKSVDPKHDSITLTNGSMFTLAEGSEAEDFAPGTKVAITYKQKRGRNVA